MDYNSHPINHCYRNALFIFSLTVGVLMASCGDSNSPTTTDLKPDQSEIEQLSLMSDDVATIEIPPEITVQLGPSDIEEALEIEPLLYVVPQEVAQGQAFLVIAEAPGAGFASVAYNGEFFTMLREGERLFTILPVEALTPTGPVPLVISIADSNGRQVLLHETVVTVTESTWGTEIIQLDESNQSLLDPSVVAEDASIREIIQKALTPERHWDGLFETPAIGVITSNFGLLRSYNFQQPTEYHTGLDFAGENGDLVLAPNAGVTAWIGHTQRRGNSLIVDHGGGVYSGYYHLSEVLVNEGAVVTKGDPLGRIGATGLSTGPHLHWEIVVHGIAVNPVQWIREQEIPDPEMQLDQSLAINIAETGELTEIDG